MSERLAPEEGGYVLCRVEGCPRTTDGGQDEVCGLARLIGVPTDGDLSWPLCGSDATVAAWRAAGLLDITPHIPAEVHREWRREAT